MVHVTAPKQWIAAKKLLLALMVGIIILSAVARALGGGVDEGTLAFAGYMGVVLYLVIDFVLQSSVD